MKHSIAGAFCAGLFLLGLVSELQAATVYSTDFESGLDLVWSGGSNIDSSGDVPSLTNYSGNYHSNGTTLTLTGLAAHTELTLSFDLYLFDSWDGENTIHGKDYFSLAGDITESWTFTNHQPEGQTYPGAPDEVYIVDNTGVNAVNIYRGLDATGSGDQFLINHTGDTFTVTFEGLLLDQQEWFGIDNVNVAINSTVPIPSSVWLFGSGLIGLIRIAKRKKA